MHHKYVWYFRPEGWLLNSEREWSERRGNDMKTERIYAVFFSPTQGTKRYVEGIAGRLCDHYEVIDLTRPENREK